MGVTWERNEKTKRRGDLNDPNQEGSPLIMSKVIVRQLKGKYLAFRGVCASHLEAICLQLTT